MYEITLNELGYVSGGGFFDSQPGWGATIGSIIGGKLGVLGGLAGAGIGHAIETTDFNALASNRIDSVMNDIGKGNLPAD